MMKLSLEDGIERGAGELGFRKCIQGKKIGGLSTERPQHYS